MKSSNPIVQNALIADAKQRLREAFGFEPEESLLKTFSSASPELQKQLLTAMRVASDAYRNNVKSSAPRVNNGLPAHSSDALSNLANQLTKAKELADRIDQCEHGLGEFEAKLEAARESWLQDQRKENADLDELRKASDVLHDKIDKKIAEAETSIEKFSLESRTSAVNVLKKFVDENKGECEELKRKLKDLLARTTVATLSFQFEEKRKSLWNMYRWEKCLFCLCLISFCLLGCVAVSSAGEMESADIYCKIFKSILKHGPFGLPLFWLTCHIHKLMNQNRRLMEEYTHKVVVSQTYTGMANQVEELAKKGVESAKELSEELMSRTIRVLCANPNSALDRVKAQTPLSEVADCVAKLATAVSAVRNQPPKADV